MDHCSTSPIAVLFATVFVLVRQMVETCNQYYLVIVTNYLLDIKFWGARGEFARSDVLTIRVPVCLAHLGQQSD